MKKTLIIDTNVLCVWLGIPGFERCGPDHDLWTQRRVEEIIQTEIERGSTLILPLATMIETGLHIAQAKHSRKERAEGLAELMRKSARGSRKPLGSFFGSKYTMVPAKD